MSKGPVSIETIVDKAERKVAASLAAAACGPCKEPFLEVPLAVPRGSALAASFGSVWPWGRALKEWAEGRPVSLKIESRPVKGVYYDLPVAATVGTVEDAAALCGMGARLKEARRRREALRTRFPSMRDELEAVKESIKLTKADFETLLDVAGVLEGGAWAGRFSREVPVRGCHAKWIDSHRSVLSAIVGDGALPRKDRPKTLLFRYLDPAHLVAGGRAYDSWCEEDPNMRPAYLPSTVVICENDDTAHAFPDTEGGVAVFGRGAGPLAAKCPWVRACPRVLYWGDMDASGFEILSSYRAAGLGCESVAMGTQAYGRWERFGTNTDKHGRPIQPKKPHEDLLLDEDEYLLYRSLCSPEWKGFRRVEQERVGFDEAISALKKER